MPSPAADREYVKRKGLIGFVEVAWHKIEACELTIEPHMPLVCTHYEAVGRGEIRDLIVEIPPGMSKSTMTSILWPAYDWACVAPWRKWLHTSYDEHISHDFARRTLELIQSPWYRERWPHIVVKGGGRAAVGDFWLESGGRRFSTMMAGAATGVHAHILVCDDPHKPDEIKKGGEIAKKNLEGDWKSWSGTFSSRHADAASFARVVIAQRLHQDDISGRMKRSPKTVSVHLPMEFVPKKRMVTKWGRDWRTEEGELLAPKRFPVEVIEAKKDPHTGMSGGDYAAQMQQSPSPESGNLLLEEWFQRRWTHVPSGLTSWLLSVDASFKDTKSSDFVAIGVWARLGTTPYMLDLVNQRLSFTATCAEIRRLMQQWPLTRTLLVEDKANGSAIIDVLKTEFMGVVPVNPEGSKYARAVAATATLKSVTGCVFPANHPLMAEFIEQCKNFPMASHDDMVDQMTQALKEMHVVINASDFLGRMNKVVVPGKTKYQ
jgi:predicted phage terminase large subunit-like protein